jgi:hypothetical protein
MTYDFLVLPGESRDALIVLARGVPDAFFASLHLALTRRTRWTPPELDEHAARKALDRVFTWTAAARAVERTTSNPAAWTSWQFLANLCADLWEQIASFEVPVN